MALAITVFSKFEDVRLAVMALIRGEQNNVGRATLGTGTSTVVSHPNCAPDKSVSLTPTSAGAAAAMAAGWYVPEATVVKGGFTIQHIAGAAGRTIMYELSGGG